MTRKDYVLIAQAIKATVSINPNDRRAFWAIEMVSEKIAEVLVIDNPRFDRIRFLTACGV